MDEGKSEFLTEGEELSTRVFQVLLSLESGAAPGPKALDALYRDIHTIKGLAQLFDVPQVASLADVMETALEPIRLDPSLLTRELIGTLIEQSGTITKFLGQIASGIEPTVAAGPTPDDEPADEWKILDLNKNAQPLQQLAQAQIQVQIQASTQAVAQPVATHSGHVPNLVPTVGTETIQTTDSRPSAPALAPATVPAEVSASAQAWVPAEASTAAPAPVAAPSPVQAPPVAHREPVETTGLIETVRVPVPLLDKLMSIVGEMVLVRNQVLQFAIRQDDFEFSNLSQRLDLVTSEMQGEVMKTRMQPIGNVLSKFQRVVRDLAKDLGKKLDLTLGGVETELDKTLLEAIKDPLMHIVRNSCDHGIEMPEVRRKAGKPEAGKVSINAFHEGGQVIVEILDDGAGLNPQKLIAKAIEKNILTPERAKELSEREINALIFAPGFSTAAKVTNVSGRGVGMDVVKSNIDKIGGVVEIDSALGKGMVIRLKIPLTLAIVPAMIVRCGNERYAIPQVKLVELLRLEKNVSPSKIETLHGRSVFRLRGKLLSLLDLRDVLAWTDDFKVSMGETSAHNIAVLQSDHCTFGLIVDEVQDTADIVVKPLTSFLKTLSIYSGATVLGDGSVALILDVLGIARRSQLSLTAGSEDDARDQIDPSVLSETQEFLLFKSGQSELRYAIPLALVHRLEEFEAGDIETSGAQRVVNYRGSILPILSLNGLVNNEVDVPTPAEHLTSVIVVAKSERLFGIQVQEIFDVLATEETMDDQFSDRPTILGNLMTKNGIVVVIDALRVIDDYCAKNLSVPPKPIKIVTENRARKIIFAEDTNFFRKHVVSVLEKAGYEVTTARDGKEALDILNTSERGEYDILLSDIEMPNMNGFELVRVVRAHPTWSDLPAVALTTRVSEEHIANGLAAGFHRYLEKMKAEVLLAELQNVMNPTRKKVA